ncbi:MAG: polysaccharide lyase family 8 super-sandwich domain-containing protein [Anaerorhabdus sp.]
MSIKKIIKISLAVGMMAAIVPTSNRQSLVYATEADGNYILNGGFENTESSPEVPNGPSGTWWNTDLWVNDLKPVSWDFQLYPASEGKEYYQAELINSEIKEGNLAVKVTKSGGEANSQAFFKQMRTAIEPNKVYDVSFWVKTENLSDNQYSLTIAQRNSGGTEISSAAKIIYGLTHDEWTFVTTSFSTTATTTQYDLVFKILNGATGTFYLDDIQVKENIPPVSELESISIVAATTELKKGEGLQLSVQAYPSDATLPGCVWSSTDESVASVNDTGRLTALQIGKMTVQVNCGEFNAETEFTVVQGDVQDSNNILSNGGFEEEEQSPDVPNGPSGTWWNTDLWSDNKKAVSWDFQRWNISQPNQNFNATLDESTMVEGNQSVKLTVIQSNSTTQAFLKQINVAVDANTYYDLLASTKLESLSGTAAIMRIEEYTASGSKVATTDYSLGKGTSQWEEQIQYFKTRSNTAKINLIFVIPASTTGSVWVDNVYLGKKDISLKEITLDETRVVLSNGETKVLTATLNPTYTDEIDLIWESDNSSVAIVDEQGKITALAPGTAQISVRSETNEEIQAHSSVKVVDGEILVEEIEIIGGDILLEEGSKRFVDYNLWPSTAVNLDLDLIWSSSDNNIFKVDSISGRIEAVGVGQGILSLTSADNSSVTTSIVVRVGKDETSSDYSLMKERWLLRIVGDENLNLDNEYIADYVSELSAEAQSLWDAMDKSENRATLWTLQVGDTSSADITTQFTKINTLALAFGTKGSALEGNRELYFDILEAIEFMVTEKKYNGITGTSNWWDCQIGAAQQFTDTLMILSDYMTYEEIKVYADCIGGYASNPAIQWPGITATGANRTDIGISVLGTAILLEDDAKMDLVAEKIPQVFQLVTSGDGLYLDGSLVQHTIYAYSGSYGNELMKGIGRILSTTEGTEWEFTNASIENVYKTISEGYIPLMQDGRMMSMVSGRSISRAPGTNKFSTEYSAGQETIANIMVISNFAPEEYADEFNQNVKYWIQSSEDMYNFFANARDIEALQNADKLMNDMTVSAKYTFEGVKVFSMDRVVQSTSTYAVGISMYSSRSGNYELQTQGSGSDTKYENMRGWHQADGALYLYTDEYSSYEDGFWATVDSYRLPGTTADTRQLSLGSGKGVKSKQSWVGGSTNGSIGAVGMYLDKTNVSMDLTVKKSWFLLEDKIIALGSDINGETEATIETIVENRLLGKTSELAINREVIINGVIDDGAQKTQEFQENSWVYLDGAQDGTSIGYYFPDGATVTTLKESRSDSYLSINTLFVDGKTYEHDYFTMMIQHGSEVVDGNYTYVLMPGKTEKEVSDYAENNTLEILRNDDDAHAIKDDSIGLFAMNVWKESGYSLNGYGVDKQASLLVQQIGDEIEITISDPTRKQGEITILMDAAYESIISCDPQIVPLADENGFIFTSNASDGGASSTVKLKIDILLETSQLEAAISLAKTINGLVYTPRSYANLKTFLAQAEETLTQATMQDEIDQATESLMQSINKLVYRANFSKLISLINECNLLVKNDYTTASWNSFELILNEATAMVQDKNTSQSTLNDMVSRLTTAKEALKKQESISEVNKSKLRAEISLMASLNEEDYTTESWAIYIAVIDDGKTILAKENATQNEVDLATQKIKEAREFLVKEIILDESSLDKILEVIDSLDENDYTSESWNRFTEITNSLKEELNKEGITQEELNQIVMKLENAVNLLVKEEVNEIPDTNSDSDSAMLWVGLGTVCFALIALLAWLLIRKKI